MRNDHLRSKELGSVYSISTVKRNISTNLPDRGLIRQAMLASNTLQEIFIFWLSRWFLSIFLFYVKICDLKYCEKFVMENLKIGGLIWIRSVVRTEVLTSYRSQSKSICTPNMWRHILELYAGTDRVFLRKGPLITDQ